VSRCCWTQRVIIARSVTDVASVSSCWIIPPCDSCAAKHGECAIRKVAPLSSMASWSIAGVVYRPIRAWGVPQGKRSLAVAYRLGRKHTGKHFCVCNRIYYIPSSFYGRKISFRAPHSWRRCRRGIFVLIFSQCIPSGFAGWCKICCCAQSIARRSIMIDIFYVYGTKLLDARSLW